ncbi:hypothetical protein ACP70R_039629 [Stipagrostis hirtigluma subsp. patula]
MEKKGRLYKIAAVGHVHIGLNSRLNEGPDSLHAARKELLEKPAHRMLISVIDVFISVIWQLRGCYSLPSADRPRDDCRSAEMIADNDEAEEPETPTDCRLGVAAKPGPTGAAEQIISAAGAACAAGAAASFLLVDENSSARERTVGAAAERTGGAAVSATRRVGAAAVSTMKRARVASEMTGSSGWVR